MAILETVIGGLILASITGLTWLSYSHYNAYMKLSPVVSRVAFDIVIAITFFNYGIMKSSLFILSKYMTLKDASALSSELDKLTVPFSIAVPIYFALIIYLTILDNLPNMLRKKQE